MTVRGVAVGGLLGVVLMVDTESPELLAERPSMIQVWNAVDAKTLLHCLVVRSCLASCSPMVGSILFFAVSQSLLKFMSIELVMPSKRLILCRPLLLLPSIFPIIRFFSSVLAVYIRWQTYWSVSFNISPFSEYLGLISFKIDWFDLLAVQGTLNCLLQHHSSKSSILQCLPFFMTKHSHPYTTTGKTIALTIQTFFVGKVMPLLFNTVSLS